MNLSDIPAVYVTALCGMISVAFLWAMIVTCFPAFCWFDIRRQNAGRMDMLFCIKKDASIQAAENAEDEAQGDVDSGSSRGISGYVYDVSTFSIIVV